MESTMLKYLIIAMYYVCSILIFNKIYDASHTIVDELFHLPQGKAYCERNITYWNNKITTLPGLYIFSAITSVFGECSTYTLRLINLIASGINLLLFSNILMFIYGKQFKTLILALNFALLPPLYFFAHVYYSDILSLTFVLAYSLFSVFNKSKILTFIIGVSCIAMRQTNVVWIAMVLGRKVLELLLKTARVGEVEKKYPLSPEIRNAKLKRYYNMRDLIMALKYHIQTYFSSFFKFVIVKEWMFIFIHTLLLGLFLGFVIWNGSIVVGDKEAHSAALHIPQLFYFLVFYGVFSLPHVIFKLKSTLKLMLSNKLKVLLLLIVFLVIVHFNTIVHPYLLADNRHYTFYVWNRWYGKYDFAIYASVPVYVFLLFSLYDNLRYHNCITFILSYIICTIAVLCLQKMIEVRYFLIPYIIIRMRFANPPWKLVICEFVWYMLINFVTFYIFFNKEFMWRDFDYPQRIIW